MILPPSSADGVFDVAADGEKNSLSRKNRATPSATSETVSGVFLIALHSLEFTLMEYDSRRLSEICGLREEKEATPWVGPNCSLVA